MLLLLDLVLTVRKCAPIPIPTNVLQPVFANFCSLLNFETLLKVTLVARVYLLLLIFVIESIGLSLTTHIAHVVLNRKGCISGLNVA